MDVQDKRARYREVRGEGARHHRPGHREIEGAITEGKKLAAELEGNRLAAPPELMKALEEFSRSPRP